MKSVDKKKKLNDIWSVSKNFDKYNKESLDFTWGNVIGLPQDKYDMYLDLEEELINVRVRSIISPAKDKITYDDVYVVDYEGKSASVRDKKNTKGHITNCGEILDFKYRSNKLNDVDVSNCRNLKYITDFNFSVGSRLRLFDCEQVGKGDLFNNVNPDYTVLDDCKINKIKCYNELTINSGKYGEIYCSKRMMIKPYISEGKTEIDKLDFYGDTLFMQNMAEINIKELTIEKNTEICVDTDAGYKRLEIEKIIVFEECDGIHFNHIRGVSLNNIEIKDTIFARTLKRKDLEIRFTDVHKDSIININMDEKYIDKVNMIVENNVAKESITVNGKNITEYKNITWEV